METSAEFLTQGLVYAGLLVKIMLLARLGRLGLVRRYPVLSVYLAFSLLRNIAYRYLVFTGLGLFGRHGANALLVYTQPVLWVLYPLILLELYSRMLEEYPGVYRLGRMVLLGGLGSVTALCLGITAVAEQAGTAATDRYPFIAYMVLQDRAVFLGLSFLSLILLVFVSHYRLPVPRNVWILLACFGSYFFWSALVGAFRWHFGEVFRPARNLANALVYSLALAGAAWRLSTAGEEETSRARGLAGAASRELEAALALQLRSFNETLVRVLKQ